MQPIRIILTRRSEYIAGDAFEVFGDGGLGTVDYDHPLTFGPILLWPEAPPSDVHLGGGHLMGSHLEGVYESGHLEGLHLQESHLMPEAVLVWESDPYVFGKFQHVLKMVDAVGNRSVDPSPAFVYTINSAPQPPRRFEKVDYISGADQVRFRFVSRPPLSESFGV